MTSGDNMADLLRAAEHYNTLAREKEAMDLAGEPSEIRDILLGVALEHLDAAVRAFRRTTDTLEG